MVCVGRQLSKYELSWVWNIDVQFHRQDNLEIELGYISATVVLRAGQQLFQLKTYQTDIHQRFVWAQKAFLSFLCVAILKRNICRQRRHNWSCSSGYFAMDKSESSKWPSGKVEESWTNNQSWTKFLDFSVLMLSPGEVKLFVEGVGCVHAALMSQPPTDWMEIFVL